MAEKLIEVRNSPIHGRGVFAVQDIKKGMRIIEYKGMRMTQKESDIVYGNTSDTGHRPHLPVHAQRLLRHRWQ